MLGGSSGRDSPSPAAAAVTEQAPMSVASSNPGSNPESSPRQQTSPMDAATQHTNGIEPSDPKPSAAPAATDTSTANSPIPSRTSSRADKQSTLEKSQETTNHDPEGTLRGSRRSILNRRRDKSSGSSRRSRRRNQDSANMEPKAATNPEVREPPAPEKKSRGSSKFLAIFCCCPSSGIDADETIPPAKKTVRPTGPETQPTPEKVDVNTGDSSTVEPKEPNYVGEEKNVAVTSDQSQPTMEEEGKPVSGEHDSQAAGEVPATSQHESPQDDSSQEKHDETYDSQEPQATPGATAAVDGGAASETIVDTKQKSAQDDESSAIAQVTEPAPDTDDHPATPTPPSDTNMPLQEEEAAVLPINIPPPPPLGPEVQVAPHERPVKLLPPVLPHLRGRKCLVLDLDETLVHSSFKVLERADFTIPVEIEGQYHNIYVIKRPGVDEFMKRVGELFEVVVFTASVSKYGDPLLDQLDIHNVVHHRLFRDSCYNHQGNYVKDLSQIGRDLRETIIIDNSPTSYIFHPQHAIPISSWFSDAHDNELLDLIPLLEDLAGAQVRDVSLVLDISC